MREKSLASNPWVLVAEVDPDRVQFEHLKYPPFVVPMNQLHRQQFKFPWGDLKIEGYIGGKMVISKSFSGLGADQKFSLVADDATLAADGADCTRVVLRVTDEFGALRTYAGDPVVLTLEGPADLIGDNPFGLIGGTGAVWVRAKEQAGKVRLTAKHPRLGSQTVEIALTAVAAESV